jgi:cytochrome subunit of sulfide dehydrogenase
MKVWLRLAVITGLGACSLVAHAADALQVRSWAASCANCHGTTGVAQPGMESLAGQSREDLLKKMLDFKSGKKPATLMHQIAKGFSDEQLEQLAAYFSVLKK